VIGTPATDVILGIGAGVLAKPITIPGLGVLYLVPPIGLLPIGRIPATGIRVWRFKLPAVFPAPASIPLQALIGTRLSNLHMLEVR